MDIFTLWYLRAKHNMILKVEWKEKRKELQYVYVQMN